MQTRSRNIDLSVINGCFPAIIVGTIRPMPLRVRVHWVAMYADARSDENNSDKSLESSFFRVYRLLLRSSGQGVGDHPNDEEYTETAES